LIAGGDRQRRGRLIPVGRYTALQAGDEVFVLADPS
jgi:hypothetical protein